MFYIPRFIKWEIQRAHFVYNNIAWTQKTDIPQKKQSIFSTWFSVSFFQDQEGKMLHPFKSHVFLICFRKCRLNKRISRKKSPANPVGETPLHFNQRTKALDGNVHLSPWHHLPRPGFTRTKTSGKGKEFSWVYTHPSWNVGHLSDSPSGIVVLFFFAKKNWRNSKFRMLRLLRQSLEVCDSGICFLDGFKRGKLFSKKKMRRYGVFVPGSQSPCWARVQANRMQNLVPFFWRDKEGYIYILYTYIYTPEDFGWVPCPKWRWMVQVIFSWDPWL